ncbi:UNVERIFIED_CONTAM: DNA polymerase-3 subunit gamma/tau [Acetivibrio alkalicellulosi]
MSHLALYRKWRPMVFEDVVEQEHVIKTLTNSVMSERVAHAYLFCGTRGTGKTTTAKIFSRAVNCINPVNGDPCNKCEICIGILSGSILDVIEIDAASNNSVDNVRDLRDEVIYTPSKAKYRVYIIDEVHMLSTGAFNALLKTLEEPPSHVIFILATTEPHKLPATILSRCQRFDFRRIPIESTVKRIEYIAKESGIQIQKEASKLIAKLSDGALRDAISILDQCISTGSKELTFEEVLSVSGIVNDTFVGEMIEAIVSKQTDKILNLIENLVMDGKSIGQFVSDLVHYYRNILICCKMTNPEDIIDASLESIQKMKELSKNIQTFEAISIIKELSSLEASLKWSAQPRIMLETTLIKISESSLNIEDGFVLDRIKVLEKKVNDILSKGISIKTVETVQNITRTENALNNKEDLQPDKKKTAKSVKGLEVWEDVLKELKDNGRMVLYTNLLDTKIIEIDHRFVGVVFGEGNSFGKMYVSKPENLEAVETCLCKCIGKEIKIKCIDETDTVGSQKSEPKDQLIEKAKDIAQKLDVELNVIDE